MYVYLLISTSRVLTQKPYRFQYFFDIEKVKSRERNAIHNTAHDLFPSNGHISVFHHFSTVTRTRLKMAHIYEEPQQPAVSDICRF
jgi:hypothetical protein